MKLVRSKVPFFTNPGTPDLIVLGLTHFPSQLWCKVCVEFRGRDPPHRDQSKIDAVMPQLQFDNRYMWSTGLHHKNSGWTDLTECELWQEDLSRLSVLMKT